MFSRWIRKALTKHEFKQAGRIKRLKKVEVPPSEKLVRLVQFCLGAIIALTAIEIVHILILKTFNQTVFSAISGLIGTIVGVFTAK